MVWAAALVRAGVAVAGQAPSYSMPQTWEGPTPSDLYTCAHMAQELTDAYVAMADSGAERDWQERWVTCELRPSATPNDAKAAPASLKF